MCASSAQTVRSAYNRTRYLHTDGDCHWKDRQRHDWCVESLKSCTMSIQGSASWVKASWKMDGLEPQTQNVDTKMICQFALGHWILLWGGWQCGFGTGVGQLEQSFNRNEQLYLAFRAAVHTLPAQMCDLRITCFFGGHHSRHIQSVLVLVFRNVFVCVCVTRAP